jgi:hypothetical protein
MNGNLDKLRFEAANGDTESCMQLIAFLFEPLEALQVVKFVTAQAWAYLPVYESYHPEVRWPRELLAKVEQLESFDFSNPALGYLTGTAAYDKNGMPTPGSLPFIEAVDDLQYMSSHYRNGWNGQSSIKFGYDYASIVLARMWHQWAVDAPEEYTTYWIGRREKASIEKYIKALDLYQDSLIRKRCQTTCFLDAADTIETLLKGQVSAR